MEKDFMDYENLAIDLNSLAVLVECLGSEKVTSLGNEDIKENCYSLISNEIMKRADLVDELFKEHFNKI